MGTVNIFDMEEAEHYLKKIGIYEFISDVDLNKNPDDTHGKNPIHIKAKMDSVSDEKLQKIIKEAISRKDYHIAFLENGNYELRLVNKKYDLAVEFKASSDLVSKIKNSEGKNFRINVITNVKTETLNEAIYKQINNKQLFRMGDVYRNNQSTHAYQGK